MITRLLIANRGEIACRIMDTCKKMGIETVAIYSVIDKNQRHVSMADFSVCVGDNHPEQSYLNASNIIQAAISTSCDAIHPGYGFLSEDATFAHQVESSGLIFVGPFANVMTTLEDKLHVKKLVEAINIPVVQGTKDIITSIKQAKQSVSTVHYPCILKSNRGEGGKHVYVIHNYDDLVKRFNTLEALSSTHKHTDVYIESYLKDVKHIEVQLLVDHYHTIVSLGLRDCSLQKNQTKMIEESIHSLSPSVQQTIVDDACRIVQHCNINNVCTVEFLVDSNMNHYFLEINPRIQVEHPVSECVNNIDIVQVQLEVAQSIPLHVTQNEIHQKGHAIECRLYSQDTKRTFVDFFYVPNNENIRIERAIGVSGQIPPYYDGLIAKIILHGKDRAETIKHLTAALHQCIVIGVDTNLDLLKSVLLHAPFKDGTYTTQTLDDINKKQKSTQKNGDHTKYQCEKCQSILTNKAFKDNAYVCPICLHHPIVSARSIVELLLEENSIVEIDATLTTNHTHHNATYQQKISDAQKTSSMHEAIHCVVGKLGFIDVCLGIFEATFMMGSLGSVVGEKICRLAEYAKRNHLPLILVSASGGARMQEGVEALMQMAKTTMAINRFKEDGLFISICTHPTMGGTTASFAMQGDIMLAHPQASIGFSGKRVVEQTLHQPFDDAIQKAEVLLENGFLDKIVPRNQLKDTLLKLVMLHIINDFIAVSPKPLKKVIKKNVTTWNIVEKARSETRIKARDIIEGCFKSFVSFHDNNQTNSSALITGIGLFHGLPVTIIAHNKDNASKPPVFGMLKPNEHRKIVKALNQAEKFKRPVITIIDTPGADPSMESEIHGQASSISDALSAFSNANVPIISIVLSEGGSGGALAIGISDTTLMLENAYYSIISPEGYASIIYKDATKASTAANSMKITSHHLKEMNIVDEIIPEESVTDIIDQCSYYLSMYLKQLLALDSKTLLDLRYQKYRSIASVNID